MKKAAALLRNLFRKQRIEHDLDSEVHAFVELATEENLARGMSPDEAHRAALLECGGMEQVKESVREVRAGALCEQLLQDVRFGARMLRKNPGFTAVAVLTIALGIGVNASIFAVFNSAALRPLSLPESRSVVGIYETVRGVPRSNMGSLNFFSYPEYETYRDRNQVFSATAAYAPETRATLEDGQAEIAGQLTSCNYFDVVEVKPALGRGFMPAECAASGSGAVVVISDQLWRGSFHADPAIVGKSIRLNHTPLTVVGVAGPDFHGTEIIPAAFWTPLTNYAGVSKRIGNIDLLHKDDWGWLTMIGRLRDGVSLSQARANLDVIATEIDRAHPRRTTTLAVDTATFFGRPDMHRVVLGVGSVLLIAVALVLLIACANLANLMLARAAGRTREVAVRLAVGASRARLVRQLMTESLLIAFLGGALGCTVAMWSEQALVKTVVAGIPNGGQPPALNFSPDIRVLLYAFGLTLLTGIAFGLAPALQASRADLNIELKREGIIPEPRRALLRHGLIAGQVAMCMVLLIAAGLLLRGLYHAQTVDPGYDMAHHAVVTFDLQREGFSLSQAQTFDRDLADRLRSLPGVVDVTPAFAAPLAEMHSVSMFAPTGHENKIAVEFNFVGANFFSSLGIPVVRGRAFTDAEARNGDSVAVISETTARRFWPGQDPVGQRLTGGLPGDMDRQVIGVARDVQVAELGDAHQPYIYVPAAPAQQLEVQSMLVRTTGSARSSLALIRDAARSVDRGVKIDVVPLSDNIELWVAPARICVVLAATLGGLGLLLVSIGIYGTVSYSVTRRVREIGIRMTLGARSGDVLRVILQRSLRSVILGALIGVALCAGVARVLRSLLFGVSPLDPIAYLSVGAFLFGVALLAGYLPARRALRVDPMTAIRHD